MKSNSPLGYFPIIPNGFNTPPLCGVIVLGHELSYQEKSKCIHPVYHFVCPLNIKR